MTTKMYRRQLFRGNAIFYDESVVLQLSKNTNKDPGLEHIVRTGLNQWLGVKNISIRAVNPHLYSYHPTIDLIQFEQYVLSRDLY
jgi:hypothetical protein